MSTNNNGRKDDGGKLRWDLLPLDLVEKLVEVYTFGAQKYAPNTWQNLPDGYNRYKAAMLRHLAAHEKGEVRDPDSGLLHLAHCCWNALAMIHFAEKLIIKVGDVVRVKKPPHTYFTVTKIENGIVNEDFNIEDLELYL